MGDIAEMKHCAIMTLHGEMLIWGNISGGYFIGGKLHCLMVMSWEAMSFEDVTGE